MNFLIYSITRAYAFGYMYALDNDRLIEDELRIGAVEIYAKAIVFDVNNLFLTSVDNTVDPFI